jgi:hypothetical protein
MAAKRVCWAEYDFVLEQANDKAKCPFCEKWHRLSDGKAMAGDCLGIYIRRRKAAFVVVGLHQDRASVVGGVRVEPGGLNLKRATEAAVADWYSQ